MKTKLLGLGAILALGLTTAAQADMDTQRRVTATDSERAKDETQREQQMNAAKQHGPAMSMPVSKAVKEVMAAGANKDWATAEAKLNEAKALTGTTDFDAFELTMVSAYVAFGSNKHAEALAAYKTAIANPLFKTALSQADQVATLKNAMVLSNEAKDYPGTLDLGNKLAATGSIDESAALAIAMAYYGKGDFTSAQSMAQKVIDAETGQGVKVNPTAQDIVDKSKAAQQKS